MSFAPRHLPEILGLLDIGTSKIACLMLARAEDGFRVIGFGHQKSRGLKASVVVDADAAEDAVRATIAQAEHMAGAPLEHTIIAAACGRLSSTHVAAGLDLDTHGSNGRTVTTADVDRLLDAGRSHAERGDRAALNVNNVGARLDDRPHPADAVGAFGRHLALDVHAVAVDRAPLRHLMHVVERCQLRLYTIAAAPLASALAVTTRQERAHGVTVVEFGAGSTSLALYAGGNLVAAHVVPIGSNHLTFDLTRALGTSITEAERIKKNYAIQGPAHSAEAGVVVYTPRGDDHATTVSAPAAAVHDKQVTRADISTILTSRLDALLRQILQRIDALAIPPHLRGDLVLTGGGSLLGGLPSLASDIFGCAVRIGAPLPNAGLPQALLHPAFATVAGLRHVVHDHTLGLRFDTLHPTAAPSALDRPALRRSF